jgi:hypothetical protein
MRLRVLALAFAVCAAVLSCSDESPNLTPETLLTSAPPQGGQSSYSVAMAWSGSDADGQVVGYEIAWRDGIVQSATFDSLSWEAVVVADSTFTVAADTCPAVGSTCHHTHTFFVRAVDNDGARDPSPAYVGFDATTLTPRSRITFPPRETGQFTITLPTCVTIGWEGHNGENTGAAVAYRVARKKYEDWPTRQRPPDSDTRWSPWSADKQLTIVLLPTDPDDPWSFYVQAKDEAGAIENVFEDGRNHVLVYVDQSLDSRPFVSLSCVRGPCIATGRKQLDYRSTADTTMFDVALNAAIGDTICFKATALPGEYAEEVTHIAFRVNDPGAPGGWLPYATAANRCYPRSPEVLIVAPDINYYYVWVQDDYCEYGSTRRAYFKINGQ